MIGKSRSLDMEGRRFHFMDWGRGEETILLIHGDMRTSRSFDALSRRHLIPSESFLSTYWVTGKVTGPNQVTGSKIRLKTLVNLCEWRALRM